MRRLAVFLELSAEPKTGRLRVCPLCFLKGVRPALCEGPSRHMREYYLRCLVGSLLSDRLREAVADEGGGE